MIILYLVLTIAGLFLFHGIPVFNVAAGSLWAPPPPGWLSPARAVRAEVSRARTRPRPSPDRGRSGLRPARGPEGGDLVGDDLVGGDSRALLGATRCDARGVAILGPLQSGSPVGPAPPPPAVPAVSRMLFFAVITAPACSLLSTAFGASSPSWSARADSPTDSAG